MYRLLAAIIFINITMGMWMGTKCVGMGMLLHPHVTLSLCYKNQNSSEGVQE